MKAKLRENGSEEAKERADGAVAAINRLESRLAEVHQNDCHGHACDEGSILSKSFATISLEFEAVAPIFVSRYLDPLNSKQISGRNGVVVFNFRRGRGKYRADRT